MHNNAPTEYEQQTVIEDKIEGLKDEKKIRQLEEMAKKLSKLKPQYYESV